MPILAWLRTSEVGELYPSVRASSNDYIRTSTIVVLFQEAVCDIEVGTVNQLVQVVCLLTMMNEEDLGNTDSEGSVQPLGIEPYQFEP